MDERTSSTLTTSAGGGGKLQQISLGDGRTIPVPVAMETVPGGPKGHYPQMSPIVVQVCGPVAPYYTQTTLAQQPQVVTQAVAQQRQGQCQNQRQRQRVNLLKGSRPSQEMSRAEVPVAPRAQTHSNPQSMREHEENVMDNLPVFFAVIEVNHSVDLLC